MNKKTFLIAISSVISLVLMGCSNSNHTHTYSDSWSSDSEYHWHQATCEHKDEVKDKGVHQFGSWIIDIEPTTSRGGIRHRNCLVCNYEDSENLDPIVHVHTPGNEVRENVVPSTCLESGHYDRVIRCTVCLEELERETIITPPLGHSLVHHNGQAPTCTEVGWNEYDTCERCDYSTKVEIPATGHIHTATREENVIPATCLEDGSYDLVTYCLDDGAILSKEEKVITKLGHHLVHHEAKEPTCTEVGWYEYDACDRCDYSTKVEIPATGHIHTATREEDRHEPGCVDDGYYYLVTYCLDDDAILSREKVALPHLGHDYKSSSTPATYESDEIITYICQRCGDTYTEKGEDKLEHHYSSSWSIDLENETHYHACIDEGYTDLRKDESSHNYEWKIITEASINEDGFRKGTCSSCGFEKEEVIHATGTVDKINFVYNQNTKSYTATPSASDIEGEVVIPSYYNNLPVLGVSGFGVCSLITKVVIKENITSLFSFAFYGCSLLREIHLPSSLKTIGEQALIVPLTGEDDEYNLYLKISSIEDVYKLEGKNNINGVLHLLDESNNEITEVTLPNVIIPTNALSNCGNITSITIPSGVTTIGTAAFSYLTKLTTITIPNSVTNIKDSAFYNCRALENIVLPVNLTNLGQYAFCGCQSLKTIEIPSIITTIKRNTFYWTLALKSITLHEGITSIETQAFYGSGLESINLPNSLTKIEVEAFTSSKIKSIDFGNGLTTIKNRAFYNCGSLTSISLPNSLTSIGDNAFKDCTLLESIDFGDGTMSIGGNAFTGCASLVEVEIPDNVTDTLSCFYNCTSLKRVTVGNGIVSIGSLAFCNCSSLEEINLGTSITVIGSEAFEGCSSIKNIDLPDGLLRIEDYAFYECNSLTSLVIPDSVTYLGGAFRHNYSLYSLTLGSGLLEIAGGLTECYHLVEIINKSNIDISDREYALFPYAIEITNEDRASKVSSDSDGFVTYSKGEDVYLIDYTGDEVDIVIPNEITIIYSYAFYNNTEIESISCGNKVKEIGEYAFSGCSNLIEVEFTSTLTKIGNRAFYNCQSLLDISSLENVIELGEYAFYYSRISSVTLGEGLVEIPKGLFSWCTSLSDITFTGSSSRWNEISKGIDWNYRINTSVVHCSDIDVNI